MIGQATWGLNRKTLIIWQIILSIEVMIMNKKEKNLEVEEERKEKLHEIEEGIEDEVEEKEEEKEEKPEEKDIEEEEEF
jgi:hypothetical protein